MVSVSDGFLILSGPVGGAPLSYQIYHWNGVDMPPGKHKKTKGKARLLGSIQPPSGGKAEGIVVLQKDDRSYQLIIVYDGAKNRNEVMQRFRVAKN